jgi:hypothetical protein
MFQAIYDSPWHNPVLFLAAGAVLLLAVARRLPFLYAYLVLFGVQLMLDAYLTGGLSPLLPQHEALIGTVAVPFVILGDARFFLLLERYTRAPIDAPTPRAAWLAAAAWSFLVPVVSYALRTAVPHPFAESRWLFLSYELLFVPVAAAWRFVLVPRRLAGERPDAPRRRWLTRVADFELGMYASWAFADVVILRGSDLGFALRLVPNVMYYALFLPFVWLTAPKDARP